MNRNRGRVKRRGQWVPTAEFARQLRAAPTPSEKFLWRFLRRRQRLGLHFRRQHPIHRWIVDFYCAAARVAVEVDGTSHEGRRDADLVRDRALDRFGIMVLRLPNEVVLGNIDSALGQIDWALSRRRRHRSRTAVRHHGPSNGSAE